MTHCIPFARWPAIAMIVAAVGGVPLPSFGQTSPPPVDAHTAQNPVANIISVPFQYNAGFEVGPYEKTQNVLIIQPVVPIPLNKQWTLITRWITPLVAQPRLGPTVGSDFGLGNLQPQFYFTPARPGKVIWAVGPQLFLPTAGGKTLGVNKWGGGPAFALLTMKGPWVIGALANNVWAGTGRRRVNTLTLNPFVNYNLAKGWYVSSSPVLTSNWTAQSDNRWTVPIGGGVGRLFKLEGHPVNARVQLFTNAVRPDYAAKWTAQFQLQFLFPRGKPRPA
jgi:hypothetical protein